MESLKLQKLQLRFFDLEAIIQSDSKNYINLFQRMYRRFQANGEIPAARTIAEFVVLTQPTNPWGQPVMLINGEVQHVRAPSLLDGYVYESILHSIIAQVRSHFLIHAGVVSRQGQGIVLAGDSGHGKTTLLLELVRRGFKFLSDEMAAIGRMDRLVSPFPRSLRIRPGTLERVGFAEPVVGTPVWLNKLILDIEEIKPNSMGTRVPISHIVILRDPADPRGVDPESSERRLNFVVDHVDDAFLAALRRIEGVANLQAQIEQGYAVLRFDSTRPTQRLPHIEAVCREHQVLILEISKQPQRYPNFNLPVRLETITPRQGVMELIRRFQGGHRSALLQNEFGGSSTRLFLELADLIGEAQCHQLFVGSLKEMADAISALVNPYLQ